jgi:nucleoside-diphosphate-sugar epimerase|tara:strand:+ start:913 stop:1710 length:798 start_codon:yes stop_codon:yes gene_type:complete
MKILIIGKNSFLAKNFIKKYSRINKFFYFNLRFSNNYKNFLNNVYKYVNKKKINHIINFIGNNDNSIYPGHTDKILRDNFTLPINLVNLFKKKKINFTFFLSNEIDKIENSDENSIYALSKFFLLKSLRFITIKNKISYIKMDTVYGPYDLNFNRLIPSIMLKILFREKKIKVNLDQYKKLIYVDEILPLIIKTTKNKKLINIINARGKNYNILNLYKIINNPFHHKYPILSKSKNIYNFIKTLEWYKDNVWKIKKIIKKNRKII